MNMKFDAYVHSNILLKNDPRFLMSFVFKFISKKSLKSPVDIIYLSQFSMKKRQEQD